MSIEMLDVIIESIVTRLYLIIQEYEAGKMTFESFRDRSGEMLAILGEMRLRATHSDFEKLLKLENHVSELRVRVVNHWARQKEGVPA